MTPEILFEDEHLVVAIKPHGVLSEDSDRSANMPALLREQTGSAYIATVHRLDKTTDGVMVYAKTPQAAQQLSDAVRRGRVHKTYLAVVEGLPDPPQGTYTDLLYYDRARGKSYVVKRERRGVKRAVLHYQVRGSLQGRSLVQIELETGRTHQIRVQFASRGTPLVGDRRYGGPPAERVYLSCQALRFSHPITGAQMTFTYRPDYDNTM